MNRVSPRKRGDSTQRAFRRAMLMSMIGSVTAFSVADINPVFFVVTILGITAAWLFSVRPANPAPRLAINTILLLVVVIAGLEMFRVGVGVSAFAVFVALLLVVKLLDLRTPRDDGQILVLTVSILIAAVLTSNNFITGLLMLIVSVLIMRAVVLYQLHAVLGMSARGDDALNPRAKIDIRSMLFATAFACALIGGLVFIILPRNVGSQAFGQWGSVGRSVSGFSDEVELGRPGLISSSSKPVLDLTITDRNGLNIGGEGQPPVYLRGAVLEDYDSGRWDRSSIMRVPFTERIRLYAANSSLKPRGIANHSDWDQQFNITLRGSGNGPTYLFSPWQTVEFRIGDRPMRMGMDFARGLFLKDGMGGSVEYAVRSINPEFRDIVFDEDPQRSLITPTDIEPEITALARDVVADGGIDPDPQTRPIEDDAAAVRLIETHLRTQYSYTLDAQPVPPGEDATKWFLFERRTGHCEYYASALALMARSVGVPARVITGYIVSDFNPVTDQYVVRESNAHAWIEAEIAPGQWQTYDGTPPGDFHSIHVPQPSLMRTISKMYESIEFIWVRSVVGYDANAREQIVGSGPSGMGLTRLGDRLLNRIAAGRAKLVTRAAMVAGLVFAGSLFVGIVVLKYQSIFAAVLRWWAMLVRRFRDRFLGSSKARTDPIGTQLETVISRCLDRLGVPKPDWLPLKAHLRHHQPALAASGEVGESLSQAADLLYAHRFGSGTAEPDRRRVAELVTALRRSEKQAPPAQTDAPKPPRGGRS
ncbi:MAG: DUF3488 and transglutaminase-like domain-containing protein [Phycisphaerales bacterium]